MECGGKATRDAAVVSKEKRRRASLAAALHSSCLAGGLSRHFSNIRLITSATDFKTRLRTLFKTSQWFWELLNLQPRNQQHRNNEQSEPSRRDQDALQSRMNCPEQSQRKNGDRGEDCAKQRQ